MQQSEENSYTSAGCVLAAAALSHVLHAPASPPLFSSGITVVTKPSAFQSWFPIKDDGSANNTVAFRRYELRFSLYQLNEAIKLKISQSDSQNLPRTLALNETLVCSEASAETGSLLLPGVSFNSVYTQIWRVLLHLAADPFPEVSDLAMKVLNSIAYKVGVLASPLFSLLRLQPFAGEQRCVLWRFGMQAGLWGTLETCSTFTMLLSGSGAQIGVQFT